MYSIITVGCDIGAISAGSAPGPDHIMKQLGLEQSQQVSGVVKIEVDQSGLERGSDPKTIQFLADLNAKIKLEVRAALERGEVPLVFHGDDSLIVGTGMALLDAGLDQRMIYFDAHGDINYPEISETGLLFGMGVAHLMGRGFDQMLSMNQSGNWLAADQIRFIGTRNLDPLEAQFVQNQGIEVITVDDVHNNLDQACQRLQGRGGTVHLHIDQDVVDPTLSGASLCQEPDGIYPEELFQMVSYVVKNFDISAVSFGNYRPEIDNEHKTLKIIRECLKILAVIES